MAQLNYHIANFEHNLNKMLKAIETVKQQDTDIIVFGKLAVIASPPRDFLEFNDFLYIKVKLLFRHWPMQHKA